jgi:hypothetical protein
MEAIILCRQDEILMNAYLKLREADEVVEQKQKFVDKQVKDARDEYEKS